MMYQSNTTTFYYVYYCTTVTCFDSLCPSKKAEPYLKCLKMNCGIPNAYIIDKTMYRMHVSFGSYCAIGIPISRTLIGIYERGYTYILLVTTRGECSYSATNS